MKLYNDNGKYSIHYLIHSIDSLYLIDSANLCALSEFKQFRYIMRKGGGGGGKLFACFLIK